MTEGRDSLIEGKGARARYEEGAGERRRGIERERDCVVVQTLLG
jgi:hypothetical protein